MQITPYYLRMELQNCVILVYVNKGESADTKIGDHRYIAPEVISDDKYTKEIDTYSLGVLLHYLIYLDPYQTKNRDGDYKQKSQKSLDSNRWVSDDLLRILKKMIRSESKRRISIEEIIKEKVIKQAIHKLKEKENKRAKKERVRGFKLGDVFSNYLDNKVEFSK